MTQSNQDNEIANRLLLSLPPATLERLSPNLALLETVRGEVIDYVGQSIKYVHFIDRGLVSLVKTMHDGRTVEIKAIGIEGLVDPLALFGIERAIVEAVVQVPGRAFRIKRGVLQDEIARNAELRNVIRNYVGFSMSQIMQTAACNRLHTLEERCCRWLLIAHDSALSDTFPLTHESLAMMLGAQRAGVSVAVSYLQKAALIESGRGRITIINRSGLEDAACECYGTLRSDMDKLFAGTR